MIEEPYLELKIASALVAAAAAAAAAKLSALLYFLFSTAFPRG
jgi:hypothetical protein